MARIVFLDDKKIILPEYLTLEERIDYCNKLIEEYKEYFTYEVPQNNKQQRASYKVEQRLSVLGTYLCDTDKRPCNILSEWKEKRNRKKELPTSLLMEDKYE